MLKHILATMTGTVDVGGAVSTAEAPPPKPKPIVYHKQLITKLRETIPVLPIPAEARQPEWWALAREVGWAEDQMLTLDYVIWRESRGQIGAFNKSDPNGGSVCLLQINKFWVKYLRQHNVIKQAEDLYDPRTCLTAG
jgi:hypothetical protein